jgi:hypothetical protein
MPIEDLGAFVKAPSSPLEVGSEAGWREVEERLNVVFPTDYYDLCARYGSGGFRDGYLQIRNPWSLTYLDALEVELVRLREIVDVQKQLFGSSPYLVYPDLPGLFPWGNDDNGYTYCWLLEDEPEDWPIVTSSEEFDMREWNMSMTTFLAKHLRKELGGLGEEVFPDEINFVPSPDR